MARITTVEQLRTILPPPRETTKLKLLDELDDQAQAFVARCSYVLLSTIDGNGRIEVSPKGDEPGFVRVENGRSLLMPERSGNNLAIGLQNILDNGRVGMIFLVPQTGETLRVSGQAELLNDPELLTQLSSRGRPALLAIRIAVTRSYFHCAKATLRSQIWNPAAWPDPAAISFGKIIAPRMGGDEKAAADIDTRVSGSYVTHLWQNP